MSHPEITPQVLEGADGKLHADQTGLTFDRSKYNARSRGVPLMYQVPWSAITDIKVSKGTLRVRVGNSLQPTAPMSDPHALDLRHNQVEAARTFVHHVYPRIGWRSDREIAKAEQDARDAEEAD